MLRLTTNVTVVARELGAQLVGGLRACPRSPPAASRRTAPSARRAQPLRRRAPLRDRARDEVAADRDAAPRAARAAPRDERPVARLDRRRARPGRSTRRRCTAGRRRAARSARRRLRQALADLVRRRERVLGRDVVAVRAQPAEVGRARGDELRPPVGEVRRDLDPDVGQRRRASAIRRFMSSSVTGDAHAGAARRRAARAGPCASSPRAAPVAISAGSSPVVAPVRDEVLQDHLLQVAVLACTSASASSAATRSSSVSPIPTRIPLVNGIRSSPAARIVSSRRAGCLVGEPWCATRSG